MTFFKSFTNLRITKFKPLLFYYSLIILGLGIFVIIIYSRFLRPRVPKDIPFPLTEGWFYILLLICVSYLYIIRHIFRPKIPHPIILKILSYLSKPIITLDFYLKNHRYFKASYDKIVDKLILTIIEFGFMERAIFIYLFQLIPGIITHAHLRTN